MSKLLSNRSIGVFTLSMLITGAIDSIRNLPATALFGTTLIFFAIMAALLFLLPTALVSAQLSSSKLSRGGIYYWVKKSLGNHWGFLAIWLQWINTMVWYPTILSFIAGTLAYLINPNLVDNKYYLISIILAVFWLMTLLNLKGIHVSARFASICTVLGMVIPMALIICFGAIWLVGHHPLQIHFSLDNTLPNFAKGENWISLTAIVASFLGMELAAVHVNDVKNPQQAFPKSLLISVVIILVTMILGALTIAWVLPAKQINLVAGVMQAFKAFLAAFHLQFLLPLFVVMILVGSVGGMINWIISPAKGLLQAAEDGYLPKFLAKQNKYKAPQNMLLLQAILVSVVCLAFLLMPSVNGSYWLLTDLSTEVYLLMYVLLFVGTMFLQHRFDLSTAHYRVPGGKVGLSCVCLLGLLGVLITFVVGFIPPQGIAVGSAMHYVSTFSIGLVLMILPVFGFYIYRHLAGVNVKLVEQPTVDL